MSKSCPRCGSGNVELSIMALFRAIGALFTALALCVTIAVRSVIALVVWVGKQANNLVTAIRIFFASHLSPWRTVPPGVPGPSHRAALLQPGPAPKSEGWTSRAWSTIQRSARGFFAWVASVNDDLTGVNESPGPFGVIAKLFVIFTLAGAAFAFAILLCRGLKIL